MTTQIKFIGLLAAILVLGGCATATPHDQAAHERQTARQEAVSAQTLARNCNVLEAQFQELAREYARNYYGLGPAGNPTPEQWLPVYNKLYAPRVQKCRNAEVQSYNQAADSAPVTIPSNTGIGVGEANRAGFEGGRQLDGAEDNVVVRSIQSKTAWQILQGHRILPGETEAEARARLKEMYDAVTWEGLKRNEISARYKAHFVCPYGLSIQDCRDRWRNQYRGKGVIEYINPVKFESGWQPLSGSGASGHDGYESRTRRELGYKSGTETRGTVPIRGSEEDLERRARGEVGPRIIFK